MLGFILLLVMYFRSFFEAYDWLIYYLFIISYTVQQWIAWISWVTCLFHLTSFFPIFSENLLNTVICSFNFPSKMFSNGISGFSFCKFRNCIYLFIYFHQKNPISRATFYRCFIERKIQSSSLEVQGFTLMFLPIHFLHLLLYI